MLTFNDEDFNLTPICSRLQNGLSEFRIKNYYVYGLKMEKDRPHILIAASEVPENLKKLFERSNLRVDYTPKKRNKEVDVMIGLRKDLRDNPPFAKNILKTIIFAFESKLIIEEDFKITHSLEA